MPIFDSGDKCWEDVFSVEDLNEIKAYRQKQLENVPAGLEQYLEKFKSITTMDELINKLKEDTIHPLDNPSCEWAQSTIYECLKLYIFKFFPVTNHAEGYLLKRIWTSIDSTFDCSILVRFFCFCNIIRYRLFL